MWWGHDPSKSGVGRFLTMVIFAAYVASTYDSVQVVGFLTRGFAIAVLACLAVMILFPQLGLSVGGGAYADAWRGAFIQKNALGAAMSLGVVVSGYSYLVRANSRFFAGITFVGCLFLLVMSRSATGLMAASLSLLVAAVGGAIQSKRVPVLRVFAFIGLGVMVLVLMLLPLGVIDISLHDLPKIFGRSGTLTGRTDLWRAVWAAIREKPLIGHGYGFWEQASVTRSNIWLAANWQAPHAHNTWLEALLQIGLIGAFLTAFVWLSAMFRATLLTITQYGHGALFYLVILINCLAKSVTETVMFAPILFSLFWLVISCIYIARIGHERAVSTRSMARSRYIDHGTRDPIASAFEKGASIK
jgi:O-antigen ligase